MSGRLKKLPQPEQRADWIVGELRLRDILDAKVVALLRAILDCGSLNLAAKQTGLSYKGAWQILERANNRSPKPLINSSTGGLRGGGTKLSDFGKQLVDHFDRIEAEHARYVTALNQSLDDHPEFRMLFQRSQLSVSEANQFYGRIEKIQSKGDQTEVLIELRGGVFIRSLVEPTTVKGLGLKPNREILVILPHAEIVLRSFEEIESSWNEIPCTVVRILGDQVSAEAILELPGGELIVCAVTRFSIESLSLTPGVRLYIAFGPTAPILATRRSS